MSSNVNLLPNISSPVIHQRLEERLRTESMWWTLREHCGHKELPNFTIFRVTKISHISTYGTCENILSHRNTFQFTSGLNIHKGTDVLCQTLSGGQGRSPLPTEWQVTQIQNLTLDFTSQTTLGPNRHGLSSQEADARQRVECRKSIPDCSWAWHLWKKRIQKQDCAEGETGLEGSFDKASVGPLGNSESEMTWKAVQSWVRGQALYPHQLDTEYRLIQEEGLQFEQGNPS